MSPLSPSDYVADHMGIVEYLNRMEVLDRVSVAVDELCPAEFGPAQRARLESIGEEQAVRGLDVYDAVLLAVAMMLVGAEPFAIECEPIVPSERFL